MELETPYLLRPKEILPGHPSRNAIKLRFFITKFFRTGIKLVIRNRALSQIIVWIEPIKLLYHQPKACLNLARMTRSDGDIVGQGQSLYNDIVPSRIFPGLTRDPD